MAQFTSPANNKSSRLLSSPADSSLRADRREAYARRVVGTASVLCTLFLWEFCVRIGLLTSVFLPPPSLIVWKALVLLQAGVLQGHVVASLARILIGFCLAVLLSLLLAILCYMFRIVEWSLMPLVELTRGIAPLALLPAFMLIFGIGSSANVAMTIWVAWVPIFLNTLEGMKSVDPLLIKAARSIGSSRTQIALKVVLPSSTPFIFTGFRLGMGAAFLVVVASEMIGSATGLGYYIIEASQTFRILDMYATIFVIGVLGLILNGVFLLMEKIFAPWRYLTL